eukprot:CAMPEP_0203996642 /NCGR_PEP_ID=MMETSP0360-20130528/12853_1 /ASSEMBLY_ACC=CAM_ASM_000342 /TAXON_ID=268821 /ORGANISM="Scrippsiella Hangoei, Strain SHTV-5" /LENGTH=112 /DNA_ID=CAMNT_0050937467 /DNA_START=56 /DNA_END=391 /DNA_ORIENTATION=+
MAASHDSVNTSGAYAPVAVAGPVDELAPPTAAHFPRRGLIAALCATALVAVGAATAARGGAQSQGLRQLPGAADLQIKAEVPGAADVPIKVEATWVQNGVFPSQAPEMDVDV